METDASNYAYSAILLQKQPNGQHHMISFMSKSMNLVEQNYGIPNKEALTIVKGVMELVKDDPAWSEVARCSLMSSDTIRG
jgi:hypothetical protein